MTRAFLFLLSRSLVNRTRARLKRLKQPKYLVGALFGLVYLYASFFQFVFVRGRPGPEMDQSMGEFIGGMGAFVLLVLMVSAWIFPHARTALVFSEAEIAFLFPAPVTRRALIHYKLLKSQIAILFTVLLLTLLTGRIFTSSQAWMRVLGWWVILSTLNLHFLGASFTRTLLLDRGISNWLRRLVVLTGCAVLVVLTVVWVRENISPPVLDAAADWRAWRDYLQSLLGTPPLSHVLAPFRVLLRPYLATTALEFVQGFGLALGIIALHYLWVIRCNVAFEEASLAASRRFAERLSAARQGRGLQGQPTKGRRAPFRLAPAGFPSFALLWKNLIAAQATFRPRLLLFLAIPVVVMALSLGGSTGKGSAILGPATIIALLVYAWSLFIGAQFVRCDFRQDLAAMDVLKLYPLPGWQIVAGQLAAPVVILTAVQWLLLLLLAILTGGAGPSSQLPMLPPGWIAAAALLTPFWNGLVFLIPNAAVLLFPGWFQVRADAPQGIEVTGQRLLLVFGQLLVVVVTVIPAALAFGVGFLPLHLAGLPMLAPLTGAVAAAVALAGETALGLWWLGKLFHRFDLATEQGG